MTLPRALQLYHSRAKLIWPAGPFKHLLKSHDQNFKFQNMYQLMS